MGHWDNWPMLSSIHSVDYVILLCADVQRMKAFYRSTLGFPIERDWDNWVEMRLGPVRLTLRPRGRAYDGPATPHTAGVQLAFRVALPAVDGCYQELLERGVTLLEPPRNWDSGHRTLFFHDPEHNVLEIYADLA
jgi:catechol 2,3-dioxygenase-like lactoylglutathione lyase family enzyme